MLRKPNLISLVLPVYNEQEVLPLLLPRLLALAGQLPCAVEIIFVNDGSRDRTGMLLAQAAASRPEVKVIEFSRNFGHQAAITAGTDFASGDAVVVMDADLQDPPELVLAMVEQYALGHDVVYAQRTARHGETRFKRATAAVFYWLMRRLVHEDLPENTGDFRLMSREVVAALRQLREQHRFMRGMVTWVGFRQVALPFERPPRAAGHTKYPLRKMLAFAWRAITSFSGIPLQLALYGGIALILLALGYAGWAVYKTMVLGETPRGWTSLVCLQVGLSGITFLILGLVGDYIARIYEEIKGRPLYIVRGLANITLEGTQHPLPRSAVCLPAHVPATLPAPHAPRWAAAESRDAAA
jgi:dolichol-phosphate mannosyltransferase